MTKTPSKPRISSASDPIAPAEGKLARMIQLLQRTEGASLTELVEATGWQKHSVRGALAGGIPKKLGVKVISEKVDGVRRYRAPDQ